MKILRYEDLNVWKLSIVLTKTIYTITYKKSFSRDYSFKDQIRRAMISVSCNIVEGFERNNNNEFIQYLRIAKGSIGEVRNLLLISLELGYINEMEFKEISAEAFNISNQIGKFISSLLQKKKNNQFINK